MSKQSERFLVFVILIVIQGMVSGGARAHGPQMQITNDRGQIITREIYLDGPYDRLSAEKSVYVIPVAMQDGIAYVRPNASVDTITGLPTYVSGPGLAYGYHHVAAGGFDAFAADSVLASSALSCIRSAACC